MVMFLNDYGFHFIVALFAFLVVVLAVPRVVRKARRAGLVDQPGERKVHDAATPLVGGLVIVPAYILISGFMPGSAFETHWPLYTALIILLVTGLVDDKRDLPAYLRFGIQFVAAALIVIPGGAQLHQLGNLFGFGDFGLGLISLPFSIVSVVLLINAINLMDGLDGLAGGTVFIILGWFFAACVMYGGSSYTLSILVLMGAIAGFLVFNIRHPFRKRATVFLGDAGSLCLGLLVAWYAIHLSDQNARVLEPMSVAWVLAIPIWDECAQFNRRVREGRHPFSPDRGHFHHHFLSADYSAAKSVSIILGIIVLTGFVGIVSLKVGVPLWALTVVWIIGILTHMFLSKDLVRYPKLISKLPL